MPHYRLGGQVVGWGPTVEEIDALAALFDQVVHLGCLHEIPAPASSLAYQAKNIQFVPLPPAGGETLRDKLDVLKLVPRYARVIKKWLPWADVAHVRAPANISLIAMFILWGSRIPPYRWIKYAGNWKPGGAESWSYTLQRKILERNLHRGIATINGRWENQPRHVYSFLNPSLDAADIDLTAAPRRLTPPFRALFVGRVEEAKGVGRLLEIVSILRERQIPVRVDIVGDGPERPSFERMTRDLGLGDQVAFHGWMPKPSLKKFYSEAHFFLLPTNASEGWPKVLSEAMSYGAIPLAGAVSSIPQILQGCGTGMALNPLDTRAFADAICGYVANPSRWEAESRTARQTAKQFTYEAYLEHVRAVFKDHWNILLEKSGGR